MSQARVHFVSVTLNTVVKFDVFRIGKKICLKKGYVLFVHFHLLLINEKNLNTNESFVNRAASHSNATEPCVGYF